MRPLPLLLLACLALSQAQRFENFPAVGGSRVSSQPPAPPRAARPPGNRAATQDQPVTNEVEPLQERRNRNKGRSRSRPQPSRPAPPPPTRVKVPAPVRPKVAAPAREAPQVAMSAPHVLRHMSPGSLGEAEGQCSTEEATGLNKAAGGGNHQLQPKNPSAAYHNTSPHHPCLPTYLRPAAWWPGHRPGL